MTNYNERLDEVLDDFFTIGTERHISELKQDITSLIKELVAEAKPELPSIFTTLDDFGVVMYKKGTDEFEQNLLKALDEK